MFHLALQDLIAELQAGSPSKENQPSQEESASEASAAAAKAGTGQRAEPSKTASAPTRRNVQHNSAADRQAAMRRQLEVKNWVEADIVNQRIDSLGWQIAKLKAMGLCCTLESNAQTARGEKL